MIFPCEFGFFTFVFCPNDWKTLDPASQVAKQWFCESDFDVSILSQGCDVTQKMGGVDGQLFLSLCCLFPFLFLPEGNGPQFRKCKTIGNVNFVPPTK